MSADRLFDDLDEPSKPWQVHSPTSHKAARQIEPRANSMRERVFQALKDKPMTDEERTARFGGKKPASGPNDANDPGDGEIPF